MKLGAFLLATGLAAPATYETENFITSNEIEWDLRNGIKHVLVELFNFSGFWWICFEPSKSMDSVMGGGSLGQMERFEDHIHFTGELDLIDGGFAGFKAYIDTKLTGYEGK